MYCVECGTFIDEGEHLCKGCGKLTSSLREEILAMSEKVSDIKCQKCGGNVKAEHHYCSACGEKIAC